MKKLFVFIFIVFMMCVPFVSTYASETETVGVDVQADVPYTAENSIQITVTVPEKTTFTKENFPEVSCSKVLVASMKKSG